MNYEYFKALHIIFVITWFAGLFYLPRLFIYFAEASKRPQSEKIILQEQFKLMQKRLWYGITWPSCILAIFFGACLIHHWLPLKENLWLIAKLAFVFFLFLYHLSLGKIRKQQEAGQIKFSSQQLRLWNEVSTVFLVAIIFLVVLKDIIHMGYGLLGLLVFILILLIGIKSYKAIRNRNER